MLLAAAAMVLSLVEVVVWLFVCLVLGSHRYRSSSLARTISALSACSRASLARWGNVFSRQNLVLQNE